MAGWQTLSSRVAYENPFMRVHEDQAINPVGKQTVYGYAESTSDSVYVVPVDDEGNTYLIRQYRYPIKQVVWECVAGRSDGQSPEAAARRELLEETGLEARDITVLGDIYLADGIANFKSTICLARGLSRVTDQLDETDGILDTRKLPLREALQMTLRGEMECGPSIAAFGIVQTFLDQENHNTTRS